MNSVVRNPQLLERIFSTEAVDYNHIRREISVYATICKTWSEPVLNVLWREITTSELPCLLRTLTPLKRMKKDPETARRAFKLAREPTLEDWQRFQWYARRVQVLNYVEPGIHSVEIDQSVFDTLALIRSQLPIFPNLRSFCVDTSLPSATMFLHSGIRDLNIIFQLRSRQDKADMDPEHHRDFLRYVNLRGSDLTSLSISLQRWPRMMMDGSRDICPIRTYEEGVLQLLSQQTRLRHLTLPRFWITTKVVDVVSRLDSLGTISVTNNSYMGHPLESINFYPLFDPNDNLSKPPLPFLQCLTLSVPYNAFYSFLGRWVTPQSQFVNRLQELRLQSQILECAATLKVVLECISTCCPGMKILSLSSLYPTSISSSRPLLYGSDGLATRSAAPPAEGWSLKTLLPFRVNLTTISPLFQLTQLRDLELHHDLPAAFSLSDLETIATSFQRLTRLDLFSDPGLVIRSTSPKLLFDEVMTNPEDYIEQHVFDLRTPLRVFGTLCPELRSLGVFLCADPKLTEQESYSLYPTTPSTRQEIGTSYNPLFPNLCSLDFGTSPILGTEAALAGILCEYAGDGVHISSGRSQSSSQSARRHDGEAYSKRLSLGGKIPDPIPDHTDRIIQETEKKVKLELELWNLDADGEPLGDDFAVVMGEEGEPLSLGLEFMQPDESGVKHFPGVFYTPCGDHDQAVSKESSARNTKWNKVGKMLPLAAMISGQEKARAERMKC
ncbi:hypothetical protein BDN72DRAFT_876555 [Pluteus cervinus]|uniref:Uncharacterized protein n=1 Tax=Pluteus cervinus TaxID=181527 RepID=A0ACD3B3K8_9AGAR|nr:hypothetical protein BDN72DRAFT_876555 [Pluteus cervinus]